MRNLSFSCSASRSYHQRQQEDCKISRSKEARSERKKNKSRLITKTSGPSQTCVWHRIQVHARRVFANFLSLLPFSRLSHDPARLRRVSLSLSLSLFHPHPWFLAGRHCCENWRVDFVTFVMLSLKKKRQVPAHFMLDQDRERPKRRTMFAEKERAGHPIIVIVGNPKKAPARCVRSF